MTSAWSFQYYSGGWVTIPNAQIDHTLETLSGQEEAVFTVPNTSDILSVLLTQPLVQVLYRGSVIYAGRFAKLGIKIFQITGTVYNEAYVAMKQAPNNLTITYSNVPANQVLADILAGSGVAVGECPTDPVSVKFNRDNPYTAAANLANKILGLDFWGSGSSITSDLAFNIGTRDATINTLPGQVGRDSERTLDYSKVVDQVIVRGVDNSGLEIEGSAGTAGAIAAFVEKKPSSVAILNQLAAWKLQFLNNPSNNNGTPLTLLTDQVASWRPGQYVSCSRPELDLVGSFIIQRITKNAYSSTVEVDAMVPQSAVNELVADQDAQDEALNPVQPSQTIPSVINLQGLVGLYHINEGTGSVINDSSPSALNGSLTNGSWVQPSGQATKVLLMNHDAYINLGNGFDFGGAGALTLAIWADLTQHYADDNYLWYMDNECFLQHYGTDDRVRFGVYIGGSWHYVVSDAGAAPLNSRLFLVGVYDGTTLYLYINGVLVKSIAQTGVITLNPGVMTYIGASSTGGGFTQGFVAEAMRWSRALSAQEVQELYFFPLIEVVRKAGQGGTPVNLNQSLVRIYCSPFNFTVDPVTLAVQVVTFGS